MPNPYLATLVPNSPPPSPPDGTRTPCSLDPDMWQAPSNYPDTRRAKQACAQCPIRIECGQWALDPENHVVMGVWGGLHFGPESPDKQFITDYRTLVWGQR